MAERDDFEDVEAIKRRAEQMSKRRRERELSDVKHVLTSPEGRRFMWRLLDSAGVFRATWSSNALTASFAEGKRDIGLLLWNDLNVAAPERYQQMQREYVSDLKAQQK